MKKPLIYSGFLAILGAAGAGVYIFTNFQQDSNTQVIDQAQLDEQVILVQLSEADSIDPEMPVAQETSEETTTPTLIKSGSFNRYDPAHYASGEAQIFETADGPILKLSEFATNNGPDLFVYLASNADIGTIKADRGESVSLGKLKQIEGDQVYALPENYQDFNSVVIWCRAFDINFSSATLQQN